MSFILGVDVGTTSAAAATKDGELVEPCRLGRRARTMPSVVAIPDDGASLTGEQAERRAGLELVDVERDLRKDLQPNAYPIVVGGQVCTPQVMLRALHAGVVERVATLRDALPSQVVLTHPAVPEGQRCGVVNAIVDELFPGALLVPQPIAAVAKFACDWRLPTRGLIAVYDLGGGTCEVALVRRDHDAFSVVAADYQGLTDLGGIDVDYLVLGHVDASLHGAVARLKPSNPVDFITLSRLRSECRSAKELLSYQAQVTIDASLPDRPAVVTMERSELEERLLPVLEPSIAMLRRLIRGSGLRWPDIDAVAVVGGSSRTPLVPKLIRTRTGLPVVMDDAPELTVAVGAAQMIHDDSAPSSPPGRASRGRPAWVAPIG
jgi:molecular chaperone DnaK (HSP70)